MSSKKSPRRKKSWKKSGGSYMTDKKERKERRKKTIRSKEMKKSTNNPGVQSTIKPISKPKMETVAEEEYWEIEVDCVEACGKAPEEAIVWIKPLVKVKIDALMEKFPNIEWLAYLIGTVADAEYFISDLYIPKQEVTSTSVDNIDAPDFNKLAIIGVIHSHHGMNNGFSGTDHKYINGNHNISLVISKDGVAGQARWITPCGALKIVTAKVKPLMEVDFNKDEFLKTETPKIGKKEWHKGNQNAGGHFISHDPCNYAYGQGVGKVFPVLNKQEKDLVAELEELDSDEYNEYYAGTMMPQDVETNIYLKDQAIKKGLLENEKVVSKTKTEVEPPDDWVNEDQSLVDALKEAFGE